MSTAEQRATRKRTGQGIHVPRLWRRIQALEAKVEEQKKIIADLLERSPEARCGPKGDA